MGKIKKGRIAINNWPEDDRPREKLLKYGEHTLSNSELLAIILRIGIEGQSAIDLARLILQRFQTFRNMGHTNLSHWKGIRGIGPAKVAQIKAAIEIGRRFREEQIKRSRTKVISSKDVARILMPRMRNLKKEVFKALFLDSRNRIIDIIEIEEGTVNQANPIIREIFQKALQYFSAFIICVHNHPSGNPCPSPEDEKFTQELTLAGKALFINVLDHVIIGDNKYFSFADKGLV